MWRVKAMLPEKSHDATLNKGSIHHKDLPLNIFENFIGGPGF